MIKFNQSSTWRGFALILSVVAAVTGHADLFNATLGSSGLEFGGVIGVAIPAIIGVYETLRDELKVHK